MPAKSAICCIVAPLKPLATKAVSAAFKITRSFSARISWWVLVALAGVVFDTDIKVSINNYRFI